jgi:hypothetical protein
VSPIDLSTVRPGDRIRAPDEIRLDVGIVGAGPFNVRSISALLPARTVLVLGDPPRHGDIWRLRPEEYLAIGRVLIPPELLNDPKFDRYDVFLTEDVLNKEFDLLAE